MVTNEMLARVTGRSISTVSRCRRGNDHKGRGYSPKTISHVRQAERLLAKGIEALIETTKQQINGQ